MEGKSLRQLKIDPQLKNLILPLWRKEYLQLENNLLANGCREALTSWKGILIDGHNRYEICMRHQIPFHVVEMNFACREEAVAWICANQLSRRNLPEEFRKYLIGKQYESEKIVSKVKKTGGLNQYSGEVLAPEKIVSTRNTRRQIASKIAQENYISRASVEKYAIYSQALYIIAEKEPDIVRKILSGQYKIAHKNVVELSKLTAAEIRKIDRRMQKMQEPFVQYNKIRAILAGTAEEIPGEEPVSSVKDMPAFDPDVDINVLTLTIPSWSSSIHRVRTKTDLSIVSAGAKDRLVTELRLLIQRVEEMLAAFEGD